MKALTLFTLLLSSLTARAGDLDTYRPLGFSPDGRYFAFAAHGDHDGSGFPYATVSVVEVAKNALVARENVTLEQEGDEITGTQEEAVKQATEKARLARFQITAGQNLGTDLLLRLPTDRSGYTNGLFSTDAWAEGGASATAARYEVKIKESPAEDKSEGKYCTDLGYEPSLLELSLHGVAGMANEKFTQVLQKDTRLPKSRGCAARYDLRRVSLYKSSLVVQLNYETPGFEGPNVEAMVVTGPFAP